jgi:dienelactone hydrolase
MMQAGLRVRPSFMDNARMKKIIAKFSVLLFMATLLFLTACDSGPAAPTSGVSGGGTPTGGLATAAASPTAVLVYKTAVAPSAVAGTATAVDTETLVTRAQDLIDQIATGNYKAAEDSFDATMSAQLSADKLAAVWGQLTAQYGTFKSQGKAQSGVQPGYFIVVIECNFEKGNLLARIVFDGDGKVAGLNFSPAPSSTPAATAIVNYKAPDYVDKNAFTERDISFGDPSWVLTGTLSMPTGDGPHPVVVLVQGSGPADRDESTDKQRPFRDIAWGLASRGVAAFRYDKRTFVYGQKMASMADTVTVNEEVVDDAVAALAMVSKLERVDPKRMFLLGHSLGGMLAPMIAEQSPDETGFMVLAGPTRPFEDVILDQFTYLAKLDGTVTTAEQTSLDALEKQVQNVKTLTPQSTVSADQLPLNLPETYWLSLKDYKPAQVASTLNEPIFVLQGESDYQVTMPDFNGWRDALAGHPNATLKTYPGLFHLFIQSLGTPSPKDYAQSGHVAAVVINDLADWIGTH